MHILNTRPVSEIHVISHSTKTRANSTRFIATKLWNSFDNQIINSVRFMSLKDIAKCNYFII